MLGDGERMAAYRFCGYWKDVGTLESLWDANMDMLAPGSRAWTCWTRPGRSTAGPSPRRRRSWAVNAAQMEPQRRRRAAAAVWRATAENSVLAPSAARWGRGPGRPVLRPVARRVSVKKERGAVVAYAILGEGGRRRRATAACRRARRRRRAAGAVGPDGARRRRGGRWRTDVAACAPGVMLQRGRRGDVSR